MPKILFRTALVLILLAMIPPMVIARARVAKSSQPRIHILQDMDNQPKFRAQHATAMFNDQRAMRPPVEGTVARGGLDLDDHLHRGLNDAGGWATTLPDSIPLNEATLRRGQERFNIYCAPCHAENGDGNGIVHLRALKWMERGEATWVQPVSVFDAQRRVQPIGQIYNSITHGIRTMAGYESQVPTEDRWAIAAYVKALQRAQFASWEDVPAEMEDELRDQEAEQRATDNSQANGAGNRSATEGRQS